MEVRLELDGKFLTIFLPIFQEAEEKAKEEAEKAKEAETKAAKDSESDSTEEGGKDKEGGWANLGDTISSFFNKGKSLKSNINLAKANLSQT